MNAPSKLILASGSPRRRELLARAQIDFEVMQSGLEEVRAPGESARDYALRMAREKTLAVSDRHPGRTVLGGRVQRRNSRKARRRA
jgi:septum formation protein